MPIDAPTTYSPYDRRMLRRNARWIRSLKLANRKAQATIEVHAERVRPRGDFGIGPLGEVITYGVGLRQAVNGSTSSRRYRSYSR